MEFVALDFETASFRRGSACEIGLIHFRNGREIDRFTTLIKPHETERFSPRAVSIHGITPEMVSNAPTFDGIANDIFPFIGNKPVVAHNASFDASVMAQSALVNNVKVPTIDFYCSLSISRR